jgi:hypothetical protein
MLPLLTHLFSHWSIHLKRNNSVNILELGLKSIEKVGTPMVNSDKKLLLSLQESY